MDDVLWGTLCTLCELSLTKTQGQVTNRVKWSLEVLRICKNPNHRPNDNWKQKVRDSECRKPLHGREDKKAPQQHLGNTFVQELHLCLPEAHILRRSGCAPHTLALGFNGIRVRMFLCTGCFDRHLQKINHKDENGMKTTHMIAPSSGQTNVILNSF